MDYIYIYIYIRIEVYSLFTPPSPPGHSSLTKISVEQTLSIKTHINIHSKRPRVPLKLCHTSGGASGGAMSL